MMVARQPPNIVPIPIDEVLSRPKRVALDSDVIATAREIGISFGD
jgi:6-phosphofructokinase 1